MQATSHIPRLADVKRAIVLRDLRDLQGGWPQRDDNSMWKIKSIRCTKAHLQRSTCSGTRAAAMMPDREWSH